MFMNIFVDSFPLLYAMEVISWIRAGIKSQIVMEVVCRRGGYSRRTFYKYYNNAVRIVHGDIRKE